MIAFSFWAIKSLFYFILDVIYIFSVPQIISNAFEGLSIESGLDLQKVLRVTTCTSQESALQRLGAALPVFQSRMGALLFLISALLSRGLVFLLNHAHSTSNGI